MKYTAKGLETEPYKAYSRDAFNDEEKGVTQLITIWCVRTLKQLRLYVRL